MQRDDRAAGQPELNRIDPSDISLKRSGFGHERPGRGCRTNRFLHYRWITSPFFQPLLLDLHSPSIGLKVTSCLQLILISATMLHCMNSSACTPITIRNSVASRPVSVLLIRARAAFLMVPEVPVETVPCLKTSFSTAYSPRSQESFYG